MDCDLLILVLSDARDSRGVTAGAVPVELDRDLRGFSDMRDVDTTVPRFLDEPTDAFVPDGTAVPLAFLREPDDLDLPDNGFST